MSTRNATSEATEEELALVVLVRRAMHAANAHGRAGVGGHDHQVEGRAYGDLYVALLHLLERLYGDDARAVYEVMLDSGEDDAAVAASHVVCERVPTGCPDCGWNYDEATLAAAAAGVLVLDDPPTHRCLPAIRLP